MTKQEELKQELAKWQRRLKSNTEENLIDGIEYSKKKIAKIEAELAELEAAEKGSDIEKKDEKKDKTKKRTAQKGRKAKKPTANKKTKSSNKTNKQAKSKSKVVKVKDDEHFKNIKFTDDELKECEEYFKQRQAKLREKRLKMREKQGKPAQLTVAEKLEKVNEQVVTKLEKKAEKGENINRDIKALFHKTSEMIKELKKVSENIDKTIIKKEVELLIKELKEFWNSL